MASSGTGQSGQLRPASHAVLVAAAAPPAPVAVVEPEQEIEPADVAEADLVPVAEAVIPLRVAVAQPDQAPEAVREPEIEETAEAEHVQRPPAPPPAPAAEAVRDPWIEEADEAEHVQQPPAPPPAPAAEAVRDPEIEEANEAERDPRRPATPAAPAAEAVRDPETEEVDEAERDPRPPAAPAAAPDDGSTSGRMRDRMLELPEKRPFCMRLIWPWEMCKAMHREILKPVRCGHCRKLEDISETRTPTESAHRVIVSVLVDHIAFEGNSCLTCVKMIYEKTREQLCQPSTQQAPSDTPLHYAARSRNSKMLFHFICLIGDQYGLERVAQVLRKLNGRSETALHEAIWQENMYMAELLMRVDPELAQYPPAGQGTSPLYLSVSLGYGHIARMLLSRSDGNLSYSGPDGQNALHAAALHASAMIPTLLDWKEDLSNEKDGNGNTPLHLVSAEPKPLLFYIFYFRFHNIWSPLENLATWQVLHANTSAACKRDKNGLFPIHIAALMDRKTSIRVLLKGCPGCIGFRDNLGRSFLHIAVQNKSSSVVRYACEESRFASIMNAKDNDGNTALHLAVEMANPSAFCALLANREVLLNIRNNEDQTPWDLACSKKGEDFSYGWNPEGVIYRTLILAGAKSCRFWTDQLQQLSNSVPLESQQDIPTAEKKQSQEDKEKKEEKDKEESAKVTDSTRTLGIGSVLIASVTFTATFTVPAGIKASDHTKDGIPGLLGTWYFNAFMMANTLAFICSSIATVGVMFAGMPPVKLPIRRRHFAISLFLASSSLTCLNVAFALGVYMVLAPVGRATAILICVITPLVLVYRNAEHVHKLVITSRPIYVRRGFMFACLLFIWNIIVKSVKEFWPLVFIFLWAEP